MGYCRRSPGTGGLQRGRERRGLANRRGWTAREAGEPAGDVFDRQGQVRTPGGSSLVADYDHHCIREIAPDGRVATFFRSGLLWSPTSVATTGEAVYVLERRPETVAVPLEALSAAVRVRKIGPGGKVELWPSSEAPPLPGP